MRFVQKSMTLLNKHSTQTCMFRNDTGKSTKRAQSIIWINRKYTEDCKMVYRGFKHVYRACSYWNHTQQLISINPLSLDINIFQIKLLVCFYNRDNDFWSKYPEDINLHYARDYSTQCYTWRIRVYIINSPMHTDAIEALTSLWIELSGIACID